jgi:hypothetical protein
MLINNKWHILVRREKCTVASILFLIKLSVLLKKYLILGLGWECTGWTGLSSSDIKKGGLKEAHNTPGGGHKQGGASQLK